VSGLVELDLYLAWWDRQPRVPGRPPWAQTGLELVKVNFLRKEEALV